MTGQHKRDETRWTHRHDNKQPTHHQSVRCIKKAINTQRNARKNVDVVSQKTKRAMCDGVLYETAVHMSHVTFHQPSAPPSFSLGFDKTKAPLVNTHLHFLPGVAVTKNMPDDQLLSAPLPTQHSFLKTRMFDSIRSFLMVSCPPFKLLVLPFQPHASPALRAAPHRRSLPTTKILPIIKPDTACANFHIQYCRRNAQKRTTHRRARDKYHNQPPLSSTPRK